MIVALFLLFLVLVLMVVAGHGIWVFIAFLFRGPAQPSHQDEEVRPDLLPHRCPTCRMLMPAGASHCPNCGSRGAAAIAQGAAASREPGEDEWEITARQVGRLLQAGLIDSATFVALDSAIRSARTPASPPPLAQLAPATPPPLAQLAPVTVQPALEIDLEEPAAVPFDKAGTAPPPLPPRWAEPAPMASRVEAPFDRLTTAPKRPLSQVLASFMERKNIRWGELVGGLLIVGCSIALVLSFWAQIQQHPLMKFSIFTAVTAALFGLGLYSEHRWKLPTTSSGILLTATLLIPLNFLAFAAFSHGVPAADPIALGGEAIAFVLFAVLAWFAARVIAPQWPAWLACGVMGLSAGTLAVRYLSVNAADAELPAARVLGLSALVVACYAVASGGMLIKVRRGKSLDLTGANAALLSLAVLSFAAVFPLTLIVSRGAAGSLHQLAPLIGLAGLPALAGGVLLRKRLGAPALAWPRVAATFASVVGAAILLAGIALGWPDPAAMLATSIIAFAAFFAIALAEGSRFWLGAAQAAAALAAAAAIVFGRAGGNATSDSTVWILSGVGTWRTIAAGWAALSLSWALLRIAVRRLAVTSPAPQSDAAPSWGQSIGKLAQLPFTFDRMMTALLLAVLAALALWITCGGVSNDMASAGQTWQPDAIGSQMVLAVAGRLPWLVLAMLLATHVANAWQDLRRRITWPALAIPWIACPLWAAVCSGGMGAAASAFRWAAGAWLLLAAGAVWWRWGAIRRELGRSAVVLPPPEYRALTAKIPTEGPLPNPPNPPPEYRGREQNGASGIDEQPSADPIDVLLLVLGVLPIVALSLLAAGAILSGEVGPLGPGALHPARASINFIIPLLAVVAFQVGQGLRYRSGAYGVAGLLSVNLLVSMAYVVATAGGSGAVDTLRLARLVQLNVATAAAASLVWFSVWRLWTRRSRPVSSPPGALQACAWTALAGNLLLIVPAAGALFLLPAGTGSLSVLVGSIWGWLALGLSCIAAAVFTISRGRSAIRIAGLALAMVAALAAVTAAAWDRGNWFSFHIWMSGQTAAAWAVFGMGWWLERRGKRIDEPAPSLAPAARTWISPAAAGEPVHPPVVQSSFSNGCASPGADESGPGLVRGTSPGEPPPLPSPGVPGEGESVQESARFRGSEAGPAAITLDYQRPAPPSPTSMSWSMVKGPAILWAGMLGLLAVALAMRAGLGDPAAPWPSAAVIVFVGLLAAAVAVWTPAPGALYAATGMLNLAATLVYAVDGSRFGGVSALGLVEVNVAALALPAIAWLVLELHFFRRVRPGKRPGWPIHQVAAVISLALLGAAVGLCFVPALSGYSMTVPPLFDVTAFVALAGLLIACLWDQPLVPALALQYLLGLTACARWLECIDLPPNRISCAVALVLAGYGLLTSALHAFRGTLRPLAVRLGLPIAPKAALPWLEGANVALAAAVLAIAFWSDFAFEAAGLRLLPAIAALTQVASLALLARPWDRFGRKDVMPAALLVGVAALLAGGWAFFDPAADPQGLQHAGLAAALMTAVSVPLALAFVGRRSVAGGRIDHGAHSATLEGDRSLNTSLIAAAGRPREALSDQWTRAFRAVARILAVACLVSLAAALGLEGYAQAAVGRVEMPAWSIAAVGAAAGACCVAAVILALRPWVGAAASRLPDSERKQAACVYAAEALLALLFAHIRLTLPFLFHGYLERYWPLIVMAIAFAGAGLGEAFRRRGPRALAGPLQNTGAFLPLVPVLAFWVSSTHVHYSVLLLLAAGLYGSLAFLRKSTVFGLIAALAGNGSLWYLLSRNETLGFFAHPQVWVIPATLSGLAAIELNRARLSAAQIRTGRYFFVVALYLSSTADIFINGAAHSTWLPLVLTGLSVAGVLAGVALRVRPFLFLGTAFLTLSIVAMIYNAAASLNITWIWYVAGIVLGLFIIVLFALFEKKRSTMLALVEGLKAWQ